MILFMLETLGNALRKEKENTGTKIRKEMGKPSLLADYVVSCLKKKNRKQGSTVW